MLYAFTIQYVVDTDDLDAADNIADNVYIDANDAIGEDGNAIVEVNTVGQTFTVAVGIPPSM